MLLPAIFTVEHTLQDGAVVRVIVHSPSLGGRIAEGDNAEFTLMFRRQIEWITEALIVNRDGQMVDHRERAPGLRNPEQSLVRTVNRVVSVAEQTEGELKKQTDREKNPDTLKEPVFLLTRVQITHVQITPQDRACKI